MMTDAIRFLRCGRFNFMLNRPYVMAILNVTPDSFSGNGQLPARDQVLAQAEAAIAAGADMLDIGGESTRPGAQAVSEQEELDRVIPVLEALHDWNVALSVDTMKPAVMREAIRVGVDMINDVNGFLAPGAVDAVANSQTGLCVMHMQGEPRSMQANPWYADVVNEVADFLNQRVNELTQAGVSEERILLDPGFGFGKSFEHNQALFQALPLLCAESLPVLVGVSRKSMLGQITGRDVHQRGAASVSAALMAAQAGAAFVRVHDVAETVDALKVWQSLAPRHFAASSAGR